MIVEVKTTLPVNSFLSFLMIFRIAADADKTSCPDASPIFRFLPVRLGNKPSDCQDRYGDGSVARERGIFTRSKHRLTWYGLSFHGEQCRLPVPCCHY
jgi:hypothetical protein